MKKMNKYRLFEIMERVNPDMEISHDRMIDLMMDDIKYIQKYEDKIKNLKSGEIVDILRHNPNPSEAYDLLKDHAEDILMGKHIAHLKAYVPEISEKLKNIDYKIDPFDIISVVTNIDEIDVFSDLFGDRNWLKMNENEIRAMLNKYPSLKDHKVLNVAKRLNDMNIISIF